MKIALAGDVMLGRLVDQYVTRNLSLPPREPVGRCGIVALHG